MCGEWTHDPVKGWEAVAGWDLAGWQGGRRENGALSSRSVLVVAAAWFSPGTMLSIFFFHYSWLMPPPREQDINDFLLLRFCPFPFIKVGLPLLPHHPLHFERNTKIMRLFCSTSVSFSYVNLISNQHLFLLP